MTDWRQEAWSRIWQLSDQDLNDLIAQREDPYRSCDCVDLSLMSDELPADQFRLYVMFSQEFRFRRQVEREARAALPSRSSTPR